MNPWESTWSSFSSNRRRASVITQVTSAALDITAGKPTSSASASSGKISCSAESTAGPAPSASSVNPRFSPESTAGVAGNCGAGNAGVLTSSIATPPSSNDPANSPPVRPLSLTALGSSVATRAGDSVAGGVGTGATGARGAAVGGTGGLLLTGCGKGFGNPPLLGAMGRSATDPSGGRWLSRCATESTVRGGLPPFAAGVVVVPFFSASAVAFPTARRSSFNAKGRPFNSSSTSSLVIAATERRLIARTRSPTRSSERWASPPSFTERIIGGSPRKKPNSAPRDSGRSTPQSQTLQG
mmetsp:Transcript_83736/g.224023  ORF Transcript_83736/g.224023 Transcript_83736/m.224023 type:complete len:298 (-) Transcript_83736:518-1411(-)